MDDDEEEEEGADHY